MAGGIVVALVAASVGGVAGWHHWQARCSAQVAETPAKVLKSIQAEPVDQVDLGPVGASGDSEDAAREVLMSARNPGAGFRPATRVLVAGASGRQGNSVDPIGFADGDPLLSVDPPSWGPSSLGSSVVRLQRTTGQAIWGREHSQRGGVQNLPDRVMALRLGTRPVAASVAAASGELQWCTRLDETPDPPQPEVGDFRPTSLSAVTDDGEVFVVREPAEHSLQLSRIDAATGKVAWQQPLDGIDQVHALAPFGDQLLLSRWDSKMYVDERWRVLSQAKDPEAGAIVARSARTGEATWTYAGPDRSGWIVNVIGVRGETAVVVARRMLAAPQNVGSPKDDALNQSWLIGLDRTGKERWRHDMGSALTYDLTFDTKVAGDTVIARNTPTGSIQVRFAAYDVSTGRVRWARTSDAAMPIVGLQRSVVVGQQLIARPGAGLGLWAVDLDTGNSQRVLSKGSVESFVGDGKSITFVANGLVITLDHGKPQ